MSQSYVGTPGYRVPAASLPVQARARFIMRTYAHLLASIALFTAIDAALFMSGLAYEMAPRMPPLLVFGGFILVGWIFRGLAHRTESRPTQYLALAGYVAGEAILFVPLLVVADLYAPGAIQSAAVVTLLAFGGLTAVAFITKKDFSFLRGVLFYGGILALVAIVSSFIFGFQLGNLFCIAMVGLAGAAILYDTSNVLRHYPEDHYVAAALELFASVALMFWYVIQLFMSRD